MSTEPEKPKTVAAPRRNARKIALLAGAAIVVLCGAALLPSPARLIVLGLTVPLAAIFLPSLLFSAANAHCSACGKPLPLGYSDAECPSCGASLYLKDPPTRV